MSAYMWPEVSHVCLHRSPLIFEAASLTKPGAR